MPDIPQAGSVSPKKCVMCRDGSLSQEVRDHHLDVAGLKFVSALPVEACDRCHEHFTAGNDLEHFEVAVAVELARLGVCTGAAFRFTRKALGYGAGELAELLSVTTDTVLSWERSASLPVHAFVIVGQMARESLDGRGNIKDALRVLTDPSRLLPANPIRLTLYHQR